MFPVKGKSVNETKFSQTALIDEDYMVIGSHLDEMTINKIKNGDYVDFGKLIPHDRVLIEEDQRLEMVMRGGKAYYIPIHEMTNISNFHHWEQAFRVFSNIYTRFHPHRSSELIEYNHIIHTICQSYTWENVYMYDKDFRLHMSHHPQRSWNIILQQAWSLRLKDKINSNLSPNRQQNNGGQFNAGNGNDNGKINEPCR